MDVAENGPLARIAKGLGEVVATSVTGEAGDVEARAFHVSRRGAPDVIVGGSAASTVVVALLVPTENAAVGMAAARVLATERGDQLRPGRVVTLPAGAAGARSVRGSTGAFACVPASAADLPKAVDILAVHAHPPLSEWEKATLDEVTSAVPDLVSRFRPPKSRAAKKAPAGKSASARTVVRRRKPS
jgi:hypothetical protein